MDTLTITDDRTGKPYKIPIERGAISARELQKIKVSDNDFGLMSYDPSFVNTASCQSKVTFIDGDRGILRYCGYPIEKLAEKCSYLEVAYLLLNGELPTQTQLSNWVWSVTHHTFLHENIKKFMDGFHYDAHPMGMLVSTLAALSTFYPDAKNIKDHNSRQLQFCRLIGKMPTIAAFAYRHSIGMPYAYSDNELSYTANFLNMLFKKAEVKYQPHPVLEKALNTLFILHASHEQNCSTNALRSIGSALGDPFCAIAGAAAALYGPMHGGGNEEVLWMLIRIGSRGRVADYIKRVKAGEVRLTGFGHPVYKNDDPRAKILKRTAEEVLEATGRNPLLDLALELERIALVDDYFVSRKLYPNLDFYSVMIYQAMRFPVEMFPVLLAIPMTSGWLAQWEEMLADPAQKIARPRQIYVGYGERELLSFERDEDTAARTTAA